MKLLLFYFIFILFFVNQINCLSKSFISQNGQWSIASNWADNIIPTISDDVFIVNSNDQKCFSSNGKIVSKTINVGDGSKTGIHFQINQYGFETTQMVINKEASAYLSLTTTPSLAITDSYFAKFKSIVVKGHLDIVNFFNASTGVYNSTIAIYDGGEFIADSSKLDIWMVDGLSGSVLSFQTDTTAKLLGLRGNNNYIGIGNSSILINNNELGQTTTFNTTAEVQCFNSTFICYDVMNILGNSEIYFTKNSKVSFRDPSKDLFDTVGIYIDEGSSIFIIQSDFYSEKFIGNINSYIHFRNSTGLFNNDYYLYGQSILVVEYYSNVTINHTLIAFDDSWVYVNDHGSLNIFGSVQIQDTGLMTTSASTISIKSKLSTDSNDAEYFILEDQGTLNYLNGSKVYMESNLICKHNTSLVFLQSVVNMNSLSYFFNTSRILAKDSSSVIFDDNLYMTDDSQMYLEYSDATIKGNIVFRKNAFLTMRQSTIKVDGSFNDDTSYYKKYYLAIINSKFSINGFFYSSGNIKLDNSTLECNNSFIVDGGLVVDNSTNIIVSNGNFTVDGIIRISNSTIVLNNGIIEFVENSNSIITNSVIRLENGDMKIQLKSTLQLLNTTLINNKAVMNISGDIIINKNSKMINGASFTLNSNILPVNNTGDESFANKGGTFEISKGTNSSIILVPFTNSNGGVINVGRTTTLLSFSSDGGSVNLKSNPTLLSNNTFILSNSSLQGTGTINSSISFSGGSTIGNEQVTSLSINGDLESDQDQFTFTLDGNGDSTVINVSNNATINNSTLVIRVSTDIVDSKQNTTLISSSNIQGSGFSNIVFKTYDPSTGIEQQMDACAHQINVNKGSLGVLLNVNAEKCVIVSTTSGGTGNGGTGNGSGSGGVTGNGNGGDNGGDNGGSTHVEIQTSKSALSTGAIVGIIVGIVGCAAIIGVIIHFKNRLPTADRLTFKLKNLAGGKA